MFQYFNTCQHFNIFFITYCNCNEFWNKVFIRFFYFCYFLNNMLTKYKDWKCIFKILEENCFFVFWKLRYLVSMEIMSTWDIFYKLYSLICLYCCLLPTCKTLSFIRLARFDPLYKTPSSTFDEIPVPRRNELEGNRSENNWQFLDSLNSFILTIFWKQ